MEIITSKKDFKDFYHISLGRPEIFEKVAKIGMGVHIWLLQVSKLTHHKILMANNSRYDLLSLDTVFLIYLKNDHCAYEKNMRTDL